jgi:hypothetical protein
MQKLAVKFPTSLCTVPVSINPHLAALDANNLCASRANTLQIDYSNRLQPVETDSNELQQYCNVMATCHTFFIVNTCNAET